MKMKQTHAQRLGAQLPPGREHNNPVLMTAAVRRILLDEPALQDIIEAMDEKDTHGDEPDFSIHHRLEETPSQNIVTRWFPGEIHPIAMTEKESFHHYGPHQQQQPQQPQQDTKASTGWGLARASYNLGWALFWIVLIIAFTLDCHPEFIRPETEPSSQYCEAHCPTGR